MTMLASIKHSDNGVKQKRINVMMKHKMWKKWTEMHGAALRERLDISKIF